MNEDLEQLKKISIVDFLANIGIAPAKNMHGYAMYQSPFRAEKTPSMRVDTDKNLWCDYGTGEGGSIIDLVMKLSKVSFKEAVGAIKQNAGSYICVEQDMRQAQNVKEKEKSIKIIKTEKCGYNSAINAYLLQRGIPVTTARMAPSLCEIYYTINQQNYFGLGFRNNAGGYEIRNKYFKGCFGHKDITTINSGYDQSVVVEGMMDYLSYIVYNKNLSLIPANIIVLNSTAIVNKALPFLKTQNSVFASLDNDQAGDHATKLLIEALPGKVIDKRETYSKHKDFNDFLLSQKNQIKL